MEDIGSWAWLIIAIFVVVTRVLPRLFRGKKGNEKEAPTIRQTQAAKPASTEGGPMTDFDTLIRHRERNALHPSGQERGPTADRAQVGSIGHSSQAH